MLGAFEVSAELVGTRGLAELVHQASGVSFVLVPGGTFLMGFRDDEVDLVRGAACLTVGSPGCDAWSPIFEKVMAASMPARATRVRPFLCGRAPVLDVQVRRVDERLVGRCPLEVESYEYPDLDEAFVPDEDESDLDAVHEEADENGDDDRSLWRPALLTALEALRVVEALGCRFLRGSEWELVARDFGARSWIAAPTGTYREIARSVEELKERPLFLPGRGRDLASNELGLWALHMGEWVREDLSDSSGSSGPPDASRGGAVLSWPWQDSAEILFAHPAVRRQGAAFGRHSALRIAVDIPVA